VLSLEPVPSVVIPCQYLDAFVAILVRLLPSSCSDNLFSLSDHLRSERRAITYSRGERQNMDEFMHLVENAEKLRHSSK